MEIPTFLRLPLYPQLSIRNTQPTYKLFIGSGAEKSAGAGALAYVGPSKVET